MPDTTTDHARTQLAGVLDILGKLEAMVVWSPEAQRQQLAALERGLDAFARRAAQAGETVAIRSTDETAIPEVQLRLAESQVMRLTDWLFEPTRKLDANTRNELDAILRDAMREQLRIERKMIPLTDFSSMTATRAAEAKAG
ncbi:MAG: hypothetical protein V4669_00115 [Pseudomonadota bacterium]